MLCCGCPGRVGRPARRARAGRVPPVYLLIHVVADTHCAPATPRAFTVERSPCPGARPGDQRDCPAEAARDGGYQIGPFRVLLAAWVGMCGEPL
jgi:hypothetical protein